MYGAVGQAILGCATIDSIGTLADVISDSIPWREELRKAADRLEKRSKQRRWTERTYFLVEKDVMVGAYAIRKLIESFKVSDRLRTKRLPVRQFSLVGRVPDLLNYRFWNSFDLDSGTPADLSLAGLCNQIIHSYVFVPSGSESPDQFVDGFYFTSDRARWSHLYFLSIDDLIEVFRSIAWEDIIELEGRRDANGDFRYVRIKGIDLRWETLPTADDVPFAHLVTQPDDPSPTRHSPPHAP